MSNTTTTFVVEAPSAISFRNCLLGEGSTKAEALADAYGPKPWSPYVKRISRNSWVREVGADELEDLRMRAAQG